MSGCIISVSHIKSQVERKRKRNRKNGPYFCKESFKDSKTVFVLILA